MSTKLQKNLSIVLSRLATMVLQDEALAEDLADIMESELDEQASMDGFGTERQYDPRGDFRDGEWSIYTEVQA